MARRRLNTILATTTLAAGLSVAPAWGQSLGDVTDAVESTVEDTTEAVETTTTSVVEAVEETTETVEDTLSGDDGTTTEDTEDTDDAPLEVDLEVDVAPEDEDGSPQLEVDGGVTVGDQTVDVGSVTDPIEDAVDPDEPTSDTDGPDGSDGSDGSDGNQTGTSSDSRDGGDSSWANGPGGFLEGGAVMAAGGAPRPADAPGSDSNGGNQSGRTVGESFAAYAAGNRGSDWSSGGTSSPGSTANSSEIAPPQVAGPADPNFEQFPASQVEEPTVLATPAATGDPTSPMAGMLKSIAALMVLGTGLAFKRSLDEA